MKALYDFTGGYKSEGRGKAFDASRNLFLKTAIDKQTAAALGEDFLTFANQTLDDDFMRLDKQEQLRVLELVEAYLKAGSPDPKLVGELPTAYLEGIDAVGTKQGRSLWPEEREQLDAMLAVFNRIYPNHDVSPPAEHYLTKISDAFLAILVEYTVRNGALVREPGAQAAALGESQDALDPLLEGLELASVEKELLAGRTEEAVEIVRAHAAARLKELGDKAREGNDDLVQFFNDSGDVNAIASAVYDANFADNLREYLKDNAEGILDLLDEQGGFDGLANVLKATVSGEAVRTISSAIEQLGNLSDEELQAMEQILGEFLKQFAGQLDGDQYTLGLNMPGDAAEREAVFRVIQKFITEGFFGQVIVATPKGSKMMGQNELRGVVKTSVVFNAKNPAPAIKEAGNYALNRPLYLFTQGYEFGAGFFSSPAWKALISEIPAQNAQELAYETVLLALIISAMQKSDKELVLMKPAELEQLIEKHLPGLQLNFKRDQDRSLQVNVLSLVAGLIALAKERAALAKAA